jgi:hypothetical protein
MAEKKFAKGFYGKTKRQGAPAFVLGSLSIKVDDAIQWLQENKNDKGYVNLDINEGRDEKLSIFLNEYKPTAQTSSDGKSDEMPF